MGKMKECEFSNMKVLLNEKELKVEINFYIKEKVSEEENEMKMMKEIEENEIWDEKIVGGSEMKVKELKKVMSEGMMKMIDEREDVLRECKIVMLLLREEGYYIDDELERYVVSRIEFGIDGSKVCGKILDVLEENWCCFDDWESWGVELKSRM